MHEINGIAPPVPRQRMDRQRLLNLTGAIAAMTVFGFTLGLMFPLLSLELERQGIAADIIGYNAAMQPLGILAAGFIMPAAVRRAGAKPVVIVAALLCALVVIAYPATPLYWWWFGLRFLHGIFAAALFSVSEAWIVRFAEGPYRSRIVAIYTSMMAVSFGAGPAIIYWTGTGTALPYYIGAAVLGLALIPVLFVDEGIEPAHDPAAARSAFSFAPRAPVLLAAVAMFGVIDSANLGFLPVYGVLRGMSEPTAALALTAFIFGNVLFQIPIGWLADHVNKRHVMLGLAILTAVSSALVPVSFNTPALWVILVIAGSASAGIYTVALAELGERFTGADLVAGTAAFSIVWGFGAQAGALAAGSSISYFGPDGLPYAMAAIFALFPLIILLRGPQPDANPPRP